MNLVKKTKSKITGRIRCVQKKLKVSSHEMGSDCCCARKCFETYPEASIYKILQHLNFFASTNAQNKYLCELISVIPVRKPSKKDVSKHIDASYKYRLRGMVTDTVKEFEACLKAFMSVHGITKSKSTF